MRTYALDIETIAVNADEYIANQYEIEKAKLLKKLNTDIEKAKSYKRDDTIAKHTAVAEAKFEEDAASIIEKIEKKLIGRRDFTQIICIDVACNLDGAIRHRWFYDNDEKLVLQQFAHFVDFIDGEFRFVTFNGDAFDIPQLIAGFTRHDIRLQHPLLMKQFVDLMKYPFERFCSGTIKLDDLAAIYGVKVPETPAYKVSDFEGVELDGSYVLEMYKLDRSDNGERVPAYCSADTYKTLMIFDAVSRMIAI